jgi:hypothetical protein
MRPEPAAPAKQIPSSVSVPGSGTADTSALDAIWYSVPIPRRIHFHLSELDREPRVRDPQDLHERHELGAQIDS